MEAFIKFKEAVKNSEIINKNIRTYLEITDDKYNYLIKYFRNTLEFSLPRHNQMYNGEINHEYADNLIKEEIFKTLFLISFNDNWFHDINEDYHINEFVKDKYPEVEIKLGNIKIIDRVSNIKELEDMLEIIFVSYTNYLTLKNK